MDSADLSQSDKSEVVNMTMSNPDFAFGLLRQCGADAKGENVFFAPYSITTALAMACMGARGNTAEEMRQVLKWSTDDPPDGLGSGLSLLKETTAEKTTGCTLLEAQRIYVDGRFTLKPKFTSDTQERFGSTAVAADFRNNPEAERQNINGWVLEQTRDKIRDLLPGGSVDSQTAMVLVQALYFKGKWLHQFDPRKTRQAKFYTSRGTKKVHMMRQTRKFNYGEFVGCPAVELPYSINRASNQPFKTSMIVILPAGAGGVEDLNQLEQDLTLDKLVELQASMRMEKVKVNLPRFSVETSVILNQALKGLGMQQAFEQHADFSGMIEEGQLPISDIFHKVKVDVNEEGLQTEDAGPEEKATGFFQKMMARKTRHAVKPFVANLPFLFFIVDDSSPSNVLISGRVVNPQ